MKVFVDTAPFIYFFEGNLDFSDDARSMFLSFINNDIQMITSYITDVEMKVMPRRKKQLKRIICIDNFIDEFNIYKAMLNKKIYDISLDIRANYQSIKLIDALQLATAIEYNCDYFITNDKELKKYNSIKVLMLGEYTKCLGGK